MKKTKSFTAFTVFSIILLLYCTNPTDAQKITKSVDTSLKKNVTGVVKKNVPEEKANWFFRSTDNLATIIGYCLVLLGSGFTLWQWKKEQQWKRKEALMNRVTSFSSTAGAWNATLMLESPDRDVPLWDKEKPELRYVRVKRLEVAVALLPSKFLAPVYSPKEAAIRDSFNDFLGRLAHLEVYRESKLLNSEEVEVAISNWVVIIQNLVLSSDSTDQALLRCLFLYIKSRKLSKVIAIFHEFKIEFESRINEFETIVQNEIIQNKWQRLQCTTQEPSTNPAG